MSKNESLRRSIAAAYGWGLMEDDVPKPMTEEQTRRYLEAEWEHGGKQMAGMFSGPGWKMARPE